jgi:azurin
MKLRNWVLILVLSFPFASSAWARTCAVAIEGNDQMKFDLPAIALAADCTEVALTLKHTGKLAANVMGHNWVLTTTADFQPVAMAGVRSTLADSYLPKGDARVLANTKVIGGGESTTVVFSTAKLSKGGDYTFFCSFPGHWSLMKGTLTFG